MVLNILNIKISHTWDKGPELTEPTELNWTDNWTSSILTYLDLTWQKVGKIRLHLGNWTPYFEQRKAQDTLLH